MTQLMDGLLNVPAPAAYLLISLLVFSEAAIFVGFVLPGETAVVLGGVLASRGRLDLVTLAVLVIVAAVTGDSVGYEVGRRYGDRVLGWRLLRRHQGRLDGARRFLRQRGAFAVFLGRWTAFLRAVMPGLAGLSRIPYRTFLLFNAIGGVVWGLTFCLVGYLAGNSYHQIEQTIGRVGAVITALVVLLGVFLWHRHSRRSAQREPDGVADHH